MAEPIWKDKFYTITNEESVNYFVLNELTGVVIHRGKSVIDPSTGRIDIPINSIVSSYVNNDLGESFFTEKRYEKSTGVFSLYINNTLTVRYEFSPDWSFKESKYSITDPINGHHIIGREIWSSANGTGPAPHDFIIPTINDFQYEGGSQNFCIENNGYYDNFTIQSSCPWLNVSKSGSNCFTLQASQNDTETPRECIVSITAIKGEETWVKRKVVRQNANTTIPDFNLPTIDDFGDEGGEKTVCLDVDSKYNIKVESSCGWITYKLNGKCITIKVDENDGFSTRSCNVCITVYNGIESKRKCYEIRQEGKVEPQPDPITYDEMGCDRIYVVGGTEDDLKTREGFGANYIGFEYDRMGGYNAYVFDGCITQIPPYAFCEPLFSDKNTINRTITRLVLPPSVSVLDARSLAGLDALVDIEFNVESIRDYAFRDSGVKTMLSHYSLGPYGPSITEYSFSGIKNDSVGGVAVYRPYSSQYSNWKQSSINGKFNQASRFSFGDLGNYGSLVPGKN